MGRTGEVPEPELREEDVLVEVHAAGLNLLDSKIRNGEFKLILRYRLPLILGHDVARVVVRVGSRVRRFRPGHEVYARPADGLIGVFAECIADQRRGRGDQAQSAQQRKKRPVHLPGRLDCVAGPHRTSEIRRNKSVSSTRAQVVWARLPFSWPSTSARRWRRRRARPTSISVRSSGQTRDRLQEGGFRNTSSTTTTSS